MKKFLELVNDDVESEYNEYPAEDFSMMQIFLNAVQMFGGAFLGVTIVLAALYEFASIDVHLLSLFF